MISVRSARIAFVLLVATLAILPLVSFVATETSLAAKLLVVGLLLLAAVRPDWALLGVAALVPVALPIAARLGAIEGLTEPLVQAFLCGWLLQEAAGPPPQADTTTRALVTPVLLFAGAVAASCAVQLAAVTVPGGSPDVTAAHAFVLEGVGLFLAAVLLSRRDPHLGGKLARMVVLGAIGVVAVNFNQIVIDSRHSGIPLRELMAGTRGIRISAAFPDVNAAGSYLAMVVLLAGGLALSGRRLRPGWGVAACLVLGGLWLTTSRAAIAALPLAAVLTLAAAPSARLRRGFWLALAGIALLALVTMGVMYVAEVSQRPLSGSARVRVELAQTGLRMFATHPVFGVGVGRYYALSGDYSSPALRTMYPRENAHNNFLQILAELGVVGLALFIWILTAVARHVWSSPGAGRASPLLMGAVAGLLAFLLTCLAGHPLLIREVSCSFWITLGLAAGLAPGPARSPVTDAGTAPRSWRTWIAAGVALLLVASLPLRARQMIAEANVGRTTVGLSEWQTDEQGTSFRWMGARAEFPVLVSARAVTVPLRLDPKAEVGSCAVEIYVDGRFLSQLDLARGVWREFRFVTQPAPQDVHYRRIELRVSGANPPPRIQVGRPTLTRPPA